RRLAQLDREDQRTVDARYWLAAARQGLGRLALARGRIAASGQSLREAIARYEEAPGASRGGRGLVGLPRADVWLGRTELQSGRPGAVPAIHAKLDAILKVLDGTLLGGYTLPQQHAALVELKSRSEVLLSSARAATAAERIAVRRREVQIGRDRAQ